MVYILKSKKTKLSEMGEILERHRRKTLPKSYYSEKGHLFPSVIWSKERKSIVQARDDKKMREAQDRTEEKIKKAPIIKGTEWFKPK